MVTRKELMKLATMANKLTAEASLMSTAVMTLIEQEEVIMSAMGRATKLQRKPAAKPTKSRKVKRVKRVKKVAAEEAPKVEEKK